MNKKGFILLAAIVFIMALYFVGGKDASKDSNRIIDGTNFTGKIKVAHVFADGMHTFTGEINLPTPCHTIVHKVIIAESFPEQVTIAFETKSDVDSCVQMIVPEPFTVSFEASKEAVVKITQDGENIPFEVIEAELLEDGTNPPTGGGEEENATSTNKEPTDESEITEVETNDTLDSMSEDENASA